MRRAGLLPLHRWLGLIMAPFLLIQALTGIVLVLQAATLAPQPARMASPGAFIAAARAANPGYVVTRLFVPGSTGSEAFVEMAGPAGVRSYAELDAASARPLASGSLWRFPYRAVLQVHYGLASGAGGMAVVSALGISLAISALAGLLFWWPGLGNVTKALRVRRKLPGHVKLRQWHRTVGALAAVLAVFSATTGVLLGGPDLLDAITAAPAAKAERPLLDPVRIDQAVAMAHARFPAAPLRDVRFPAADRLDINFDAPERNARAVHVVSVRPSDLAVLKALPAHDNPVLWMKVLALHTGESFGPPGIVLLLLEAGALIFLTIAGAAMWLRTRRKAK